MDYYNPYVIHPMLTDVLKVMAKHNIERAEEWLEDRLCQETRLLSSNDHFAVTAVKLESKALAVIENIKR